MQIDSFLLSRQNPKKIGSICGTVKSNCEKCIKNVHIKKWKQAFGLIRLK